MIKMNEATAGSYVVATAKIALPFACKSRFERTNKANKNVAQILYVRLEEMNEPTKKMREKAVTEWVILE